VAEGLDGVAAKLQQHDAPGSVTTSARHVPQRSCVACGKKLSKRQLVRIVRTPEGAVTVDPIGKAAGRGAYLCWSSNCWTRGMSKGGLERALKVGLSVQDRSILLAYYENAVHGSSDMED
jgi:predicted RNA-binding protein YlxR (DUF448 family)